MPSWVTEGFNEFTKRMPRECSINLIEVPAEHRGKNPDFKRLLQKEGDRMLAAVPKQTTIISLDVIGRQWNTEQLSVKLDDWLGGGKDIALLVGGPEGLAPQCRDKAQLSWSLSALTLPHPLVRVIVAEQLYRAWSILSNHPYHRA